MDTTSNGQRKQTRKWTGDLKSPVNNNYRTIFPLAQVVMFLGKKNNKKLTASIIIYRNYLKVIIIAYGSTISIMWDLNEVFWSTVTQNSTFVCNKKKIDEPTKIFYMDKTIIEIIKM